MLSSALQALYGLVLAGDVLLDAAAFHLLPLSHFPAAAAVPAAARLGAAVAAAEAGELLRAAGAPLISLFWVAAAAVGAGAALTAALPRLDDASATGAHLSPLCTGPSPRPPAQRKPAAEALCGSPRRGATREQLMCADLECGGAAPLSAPASQQPRASAELGDAASSLTAARQPHASAEHGRAPPPPPLAGVPPSAAVRSLRSGWLQGYWWQLRTRPELALYTFWWVCVSAPVLGFLDNYGTNLFEEIDRSVEWNGHAAAASALLMAAAALAAPAAQRVVASPSEPRALQRPGTPARAAVHAQGSGSTVALVRAAEPARDSSQSSNAEAGGAAAHADGASPSSRAEAQPLLQADCPITAAPAPASPLAGPSTHAEGQPLLAGGIQTQHPITLRPATLVGGATAAAAAAVAALSLARSVVVAYALYSCIMALLQLLLCTVQASSAQLLHGTEYAALFAVNSLASLLLQTSAQVCSAAVSYNEGI